MVNPVNPAARPTSRYETIPSHAITLGLHLPQRRPHWEAMQLRVNEHSCCKTFIALDCISQFLQFQLILRIGFKQIQMDSAGMAVIMLSEGKSICLTNWFLFFCDSVTEPRMTEKNGQNVCPFHMVRKSVCPVPPLGSSLALSSNIKQQLDAHSF